MQKLAKYVALVQPTVPIPGSGPVTASTLANLINSIVQYLLTISTVIAVGFIVYGGLLYMGIRGEEGKKNAGGVLKNAIIGIAIVFAVGLIMRTIANVIQTQSIG